jgi:phenylacetate-CoA ligase
MNDRTRKMRFSEPEWLSRAEIRARQFERLRNLLDQVAGSNRFWSQKFRAAGIDVAAVQSLDDLQKLPTTTKACLVDDQAAHPPYGTNLTDPLSDYSRMHQTSGTTGAPLRWLDTPADWDWFMDCWAQIYRMIGLTGEDRLAFPFSFGPFIGFWAAFEGAGRLGNLCLAGGGLSSQARLAMIEENQATIVCCTPTYALRLAEVAEQEGLDLPGNSVRALVVAGEPGGSIAATRRRIELAWGARVFDHWGMTEIGSLAIECLDNPGGLHVLESECIAEVVDPDTFEPVEPGQMGELLITNLGRLGSPLIRYRTGDLVQTDTEPCPCGRELLRLKGGILGRCDDMVTIRGNNVFPSSLEAILREFDEIAEYRIEVETDRSMQHLKIEIEPTAAVGGARPPGSQGIADSAQPVSELVDAVSRTIKDRLNFHAEVAAVAPGSLPRFELKGRRFFRRDSE